MFISPLEHFEIIPSYLYVARCKYEFLGLVTIDNFILCPILLFPFLIVICFSLSKTTIFNNFFSALLGYAYKFLVKLVSSQIKSKRGLKYFTIVFSLFNSLLVLNFFSLSPYFFSVTSHIMFTLYLSLFLFSGLIINGLLNLRTAFIKIFYPNGVHPILSNILVFIEFLSFIIRPFSLAIRLFANMLAGHTLLNIFAAFAAFVSQKFIYFYPISLIFCFIITFLEIGVSIIQSYVFVILFLIYLTDITKINH